VMQKTGLPYKRALTRLRNAADSVREALGEDIEPRLRALIEAGSGKAESKGPA